MSPFIEQFKLEDFIPLASGKNINFAEITYKCGAHQFIDTMIDFSGGKIKNIHNFKDRYFGEPKDYDRCYFVLAIMGKSYVMYEVSDDNIYIWVSYTHEFARKQGYITRILRHLTELYPDMTVIGDTFNESLIRILKSLGILIFRERQERNNKAT